MKKQLWPGVGLGIIVLLATPIFAIPIKNSTEISPLPISATDPASHQGTSINRDRAGINIQGIQARWQGTGVDNQTSYFGFSSTATANAAASFLQPQGYTLSFSTFGRTPFQQLLMVTKEPSVTTQPTPNSRPTTALPEPTTLLLLGSGLAALAAGLRKRKPK